MEMEICKEGGPVSPHSALHEQNPDFIWNNGSSGSCIEFQTEESLSNFTNSLKGSPSSADPFNGNPVLLFPSKGQGRYWELVKNLFQQCGHYVTVLIINNNKSDLTKPLEFYKGANECFKHLPNLLSLEIIQNAKFKATAEKANQLKKYLRDNPVIPLPCLKSLNLPLELGEIFRNHYLQGYGNQLVKFTTDCQKWMPDFEVFKDLTELHVQKVESFTCVAKQLLTPMKAVNKNLNKLELELNDFVDATQLFKLLQPLGVRALKLSFQQSSGKCKDCEECDLCSKTCGIEPYKINEVLDCRKPGPGILASVQAFKLVCASPLTTFQFLKFMTFLKYLEVDAPLPMHQEEDQVGVEIRKCVTGNVDSKLWKLVPSLRTLKFGDLKFERPVIMESSGNACVDLFGQVFPQLFCDLRRPEYEKLRRVCKVWKTVIDNFVQNHPLIRPFTMDCFNSVHLVRNFDCHAGANLPVIGFQTPTAMLNAHVNLSNLPGNPFIGRSVGFTPADMDIDGPITPSIFWNAGMELLEKFGQHIWDFKLSFPRTNNNISELFFYKSIHRCLELMPNLKSFAFDGDVKVVMATGKEVKQVEGYMERNPLPKLANFDCLFLLCKNLPERFLEALLDSYGGQLGRLETLKIKWKPKYGNLPNLTQLAAGSLLITGTLCGETLPVLLLHLKAPLLQKLELTLAAPFQENYLFRMLQPFESVRVLSLLFQARPEQQNLGMVLGPTGHRLIELRDGLARQMFPNVVCLYVRLCSEKQSFQFLKSFPSLKYLMVRTSRESKIKASEDDIGAELRKCSKGGKQARQSKIWEKLPNLERLLILPGIKMDRSGYIFIDRQWVFTGTPEFNVKSLGMYLNAR